MIHHDRILILIAIILVSACVVVPSSHASIDVPLTVELNGHGGYSLNPLPVYEDYYFWGDTVEITITGDDVSNDSSVPIRYLYDGVVGEGSGSYTGHAMVFDVTMNEVIFEDVQWKTQYLVMFDASGLTGSTGSNTVVTVEGAPKVKADLPFMAWYDDGAVATFTYASTVAGMYDLSSITATMLDASGHTISMGVTSTHTIIGPYTTILGTYVPHTTEPSVPSGGSTIPSTTPATSPATSGGLGILGIFGGFSETLRDFWETISSWASHTGGSGGLSIGTLGAWFNGSTYKIPHIDMVLLASLGFIILLVWRRRRNE